MHANTDVASGYLRRVYLASARRATRTLIRAVGVLMAVAGVVSLAIAALGWMTT